MGEEIINSLDVESSIIPSKSNQSLDIINPPKDDLKKVIV